MPDADRLLVDLRALCLSLPETSEVDAWGHPNFRAGKKTFVVYEWVRQRPSIAFRLDPPDQEAFSHLAEFFETPYGKGKWLSLWGDTDLDWSLVKSLVLCSYRTVALKRMLAALAKSEQ